MPILQDGPTFYELNVYGEIIGAIWRAPFPVRDWDLSGAKAAKQAFKAWCNRAGLPVPLFIMAH